MKFINALGLAALVALTGCSSGANLLDPKSSVPQASAVPVGNNLALPPDLQLASPGGTVAGYQSNGYVAPIAIPAGRPVSQAVAFGNPNAPNAGAPVQQAFSPTETVYSNKGIDLAFPADYYAKYGISRFKPNGKLKTNEELKKELTATVLAKKRETNPNYGTVANMGRVMSGQDEVIMKP